MKKNENRQTAKYSNIANVFYTALLYAAVQIIVTGVIVFTGVSPLITLISWIISVLGGIFLLFITKTAELKFNSAAADQRSFKTFLTTSSNYVSMINGSNRVIYITNPLAHLIRVESANLAVGRPLIDIFPDNELKMLVYKMLKQKKNYEDDWVFSLGRQKHYFKVFFTRVGGAGTNAVISLHDRTHLAERDEIALMRDSLEIGLFFMNKDGVIQEQYSRFLEETLSEKNLSSQNFFDVLSASFTVKELDGIKDYFDMVFNGSFDQSMLKDMNPLNEWTYVCRKTKEMKVFHCDFTTIERNRGEIFALVMIYDITARTELERRLRDEENKRQEEMVSLFELIQVEPNVFNDFLEDAEYEFDRIDETFQNNSLSAHEVLIEVYQSVHAIKSNAVILGLNTFGGKVHLLESKIKNLREQDEEIPSDAIIKLTSDIETLSLEKDGFKTTVEKIQSYQRVNAEGCSQSEYVFVESLSKTAGKAASDLGKKIRFIVDGIDTAAIENGPRRIMKEALMQLIRNSAAHGIEYPEERLSLGKDETGTISLSVKIDGGKIIVKLSDDGGGINIDRIRKKALSLNMINEEDGGNKDVLIKAMFSPGFSTAETENLHAGRGIGLDLVQARVRDARGVIDVQTELGKGTTFIITFPVTLIYNGGADQ